MRSVVLVRERRPGGSQALPQGVRVVSRFFWNGTTNWGLLGLLRPPLATMFRLLPVRWRASSQADPTGTKCAGRILLRNPTMSAMLPL